MERVLAYRSRLIAVVSRRLEQTSGIVRAAALVSFPGSTSPRPTETKGAK
jgi:hypothetical protein